MSTVLIDAQVPREAGSVRQYKVLLTETTRRVFTVIVENDGHTDRAEALIQQRLAELGGDLEALRAELDGELQAYGPEVGLVAFYHRSVPPAWVSGPLLVELASLSRYPPVVCSDEHALELEQLGFISLTVRPSPTASGRAALTARGRQALQRAVDRGDARRDERGSIYPNPHRHLTIS